MACSYCPRRMAQRPDKAGKVGMGGVAQAEPRLGTHGTGPVTTLIYQQLAGRQPGGSSHSVALFLPLLRTQQ